MFRYTTISINPLFLFKVLLSQKHNTPICKKSQNHKISRWTNPQELASSISDSPGSQLSKWIVFDLRKPNHRLRIQLAIFVEFRPPNLIKLNHHLESIDLVELSNDKTMTLLGEEFTIFQCHLSPSCQVQLRQQTIDTQNKIVSLDR